MKSLLPQPHRHAFEPPVHYVVGTPKGGLTGLQNHLVPARTVASFHRRAGT